MKKLLVFAMVMMLAVNLTACAGQKKGNEAVTQDGQTQGNELQDDTEDQNTAQDVNQKKIEQQINDLFDQENEIFGINNDLWNRVFALADKETLAAQTDVEYADLLQNLIESGKDQFTEEELATLFSDVETVRQIEAQISELQMQLGDEESNSFSGADDLEKFPEFSGKDLNGEAVDSSIFSEHAVTVVNFWFNGCSPCVEELPALNELNEKLKEKDCGVIGINTGTLDGDQGIIEEAKAILDKQGAVYRNIYFDSDSEAGKYALGIMVFPTTILVDRNGNIIGEPIVGGIADPDRLDSVMQQIDSILAND